MKTTWLLLMLFIVGCSSAPSLPPCSTEIVKGKTIKVCPIVPHDSAPEWWQFW